MSSASSPAYGDRARLLAEVGLLFLVVIWGLNFVVVKWALDAFEPMGFNALRHVIAAIFLVAVLAVRGGVLIPAREDLPRVVFLGVAGIFLYQLIFVVGLQRTQAGNASLMLALVPLFMLAVEAFRGERNPRAWLGAMVSLAGVGLVSSSSLQMEGTRMLLGDLLLIVGAGVWAVYTLAAQPLLNKYGPLPPTAWSLCVGSFGLMVIGAPSMLRQDWTMVGAPEWGSIIYSSILSLGIAYLIWYRGVQVLGAPRTAIIANLAPLVALSAGALMLGERLTIWSALGAAMVVGGVIYVRSAPIPPPAPKPG